MAGRSERPDGPGWWRSSDGRWYPPDHPDAPPESEIPEDDMETLAFQALLDVANDIRTIKNIVVTWAALTVLGVILLMSEMSSID